ncbi:MAG: hypothetical protein R2747_01350 [Pyrinomonadaceae bacterium]
MKNSGPNESIRALLSEIVDYAGLFPPSQLSMPEAVINYATYKNSNYNWMLGRFVVPVSRLEEFLESARDFISRDGGDSWRLSVLASEDIYETVSEVIEFNAANAPEAVIDTLETRANSSDEIEYITEAVPSDLMTYIEIPSTGDIADLIAALAINNQRAKIRLGGVTRDAFPKTGQIIRFIRTCLAANLPFKATAGLHHPVRCIKPLTYEKNAPQGTMNGFLNVFLAVAFMRRAFKRRLIKELLEDEWPESFMFDDNGVLWRQEHFLSTDQLKHLRHSNIISFGSCSFEEPIEDLQEIGLL